MDSLINEAAAGDGAARKRDREELEADETTDGTGETDADRKKRARADVETTNGAVLTEQETAVYDRQVRIWGVEAQRRLSRARALVVGISGVTAEICKNIVLAGIGSLTLLDDRPVTLEAAAANFLIDVEEIGREMKSLAKTCAEALRDYNPMVDVDVAVGNISDKPEEFFDSFDTVILDRTPISVQKHVNAVCRSRSHKIAFYAVDCRFPCGSLFVDLQTTTYTSKKKNDSESKAGTKTFPSLEEVLSVRLDSLPKRTSDVLFASRIIEEFEQREKRQPGQISSSDVPILVAFAREFLLSQGMSLSASVEKLLQKLADSGSTESPAVCAIMGGIVGQEIIKGSSGNGEPLKNFFFFDTTDGKGMIEEVPADSVPTVARKEQRATSPSIQVL